MKQVWTILKRIGKFLLWTILVLGLLIGSFFIWLRFEPAEVTECEAGFKLINHFDGADCVPEQTDKVLVNNAGISQFFAWVEQPAVIQENSLDRYTAADIPGLYERLIEVNTDVPDAGRLDGIRSGLELFVEIDVDLMITTGLMPSDVGKMIETIIPIVVLDPTGSWKEHMLIASEFIDERQEAERLIREYEERVEILQAQFDDPSGITISSARIFPTRTSVQLPGSFAGQVLSDVGFSLPEAQYEIAEEVPHARIFDLSEERIDLLDADYLFLFGGISDEELAYAGTPSDEIVAAFQSDPLYGFLSAVEAGNDHEVDLYWSAPGIYSAHYMLDDLFRYVAGVDPEEVAPNPLKLE
ncbi:MAG: hypothetical protein AAF633_03180 [Chloroflexota bacterium]